jgi:hypothetical protein
VRVARFLASQPAPGEGDPEGLQVEGLHARDVDRDGLEGASPRVGIVRDGALYDVEALERAYAEIDAREGGAGPISSSALAASATSAPSDFQTRVASLRCAGLYELDARLFRAERPSSARVLDRAAHLLAPCDTDRASLVHVDIRPLAAGARPVCRIGQARALLGDGALVGVDAIGAPEAASVDVEVSVAVVLGDDLSRAPAAAARGAIMGYSIFVDWIAPQGPFAELATTRGVSATLGPHLVSPYAVPKLSRAACSWSAGGRTFDAGTLAELGIAIDEALAVASSSLELRSGDVVGIGPLPRGTSRAAGVAVGVHERVDVTIEGLGTLRGAAVPFR